MSDNLQIGQMLIIPTTSSKEAEKTYIVKPGDSLWKIANQFGITATELKSFNRLESNDLQIGQMLYIP